MLHIAVWHPKGGVGKTTIALNLGGYLASQGASVILYDKDPQRSACWIARRKDAIGLGFPVVDEPDPSIPQPDYLITDHPPRFERVKMIGETIVVLPAKPVAHEVAAAAQGRAEMDGRCDAIVPVISRFNRQRKAQVETLKQPGLSWLSDAPSIADRSIYERAIDIGTHIFSPAMDGMYGVREARAEIASLWKRIEKASK